MLPQARMLNAFVPAGMGVEGIGLVLLFRAHRLAPGNPR